LKIFNSLFKKINFFPQLIYFYFLIINFNKTKKNLFKLKKRIIIKN
jgi:hypothetical protein